MGDGFYRSKDPDNLLTGANHRAFPTNHLTDIDTTKYNCNKNNKNLTGNY